MQGCNQPRKAAHRSANVRAKSCRTNCINSSAEVNACEDKSGNVNLSLASQFPSRREPEVVLSKRYGVRFLACLIGRSEGGKRPFRFLWRHSNFPDSD